MPRAPTQQTRPQPTTPSFPTRRPPTPPHPPPAQPTPRHPIATLALALAVAGAYAALSHGTLYLPDDAIRGLALHPSTYPTGTITHAFVHVGILHLAGNLVPLVLFALIVELALGPLAVLAAFFTAAILASSAFALLNPGVFLVGASAGVTGLLGAAFATRPRKTLALLALAGLALGLAAYPALAALSQQQAQGLAHEREQLETTVAVLVQQNRTQEAAAVNQTLQNVAQQTKIVETGREREATTPTNLPVHLAGTLTGVLYVFFFHRRAFLNGGRELAQTPAWLRQKITRFVKRTKPARQKPGRA